MLNYEEETDWNETTTFTKNFNFDKEMTKRNIKDVRGRELKAFNKFEGYLNFQKLKGLCNAR